MTAAPASRVIWVVDDSRLDAERARQALAHDYRVEVFHDGSAALEQVSAGSSPDVIVLDWVMPGVSGVDVCRFLRNSNGSARHIGILLLTVQRDTKQIVEGLSAGANDFLAKPYEDEELLARVASLVRTRELHEGLEIAQQENRRLLETAPDAFVVCDAEGQVTYVNMQAIDVFQRAREALLGRPIAELLTELPMRLAAQEAGESLMPMPDVNIGARRFSPTLRNLVGGGIIVSLRDVTERRLLEERRLDFYSVIAHDLRTPLNALTLRVSTLLDMNKSVGRMPQIEDLQKLDARLHTLVELINDFLDLASLEGASYRIARDEVDLLPIVARVRDEFAPLLERNRQEFVCVELDEGQVAHVIGDARRLTQAISNLVANAIKFSPEGSTIVASLRTEERAIELSISDDGLGISAEKQAKLFQRYERAEHTVGGTGLGLMIVREIVEAHGGLVGVESTVGRGSRFWLRIPRVRGIALRA